MCSFTALAVGATLIGSGVTAAGQVQAGRSQAAISRRNAQLLELRAKDSIDRGEEEVSRLRRQASVFEGSQRARLAASGVDLGTGSALDILEDTQRSFDEDALTIRRNARREAFGATATADIQRFAGRNRRRSSLVSGGSTLLGGGARAGALAI